MSAGYFRVGDFAQQTRSVERDDETRHEETKPKRERATPTSCEVGGPDIALNLDSRQKRDGKRMQPSSPKLEFIIRATPAIRQRLSVAIAAENPLGFSPFRRGIGRSPRS